MSLTYQSLSKKPKCLQKLTGLSLKEFGQLVEAVRPAYLKWESSKKVSGRPSGFSSLEDKLLCQMMYYRTYVTHTFLGYLFNVDNSNVCRMLKVLEPMVAKVIHIKKDRTLTQDKVTAILADVTEMNTQRPKKKQKDKYSGKKKRHTLKSELGMSEDGKIISVSKVYGGSTHDFTIRKNEKPFCRDSVKLVDSGYQGLQKREKNVWLPYKGTKTSPLTKEQKAHNKALAQLRIRIENKIAELKVFKMLSERYRNFQKKMNLRFNIIAGLVNMKHGF
jgi:transposase